MMESAIKIAILSLLPLGMAALGRKHKDGPTRSPFTGGEYEVEDARPNQGERLAARIAIGAGALLACLFIAAALGAVPGLLMNGTPPATETDPLPLSFSLLSFIAIASFYEWISRTAKARFQGRLGPRPVQPIADLLKTLQKTHAPNEYADPLLPAIPWLSLLFAIFALSLLPLPKPFFSGDHTLLFIAALVLCRAIILAFPPFMAGDLDSLLKGAEFDLESLVYPSVLCIAIASIGLQYGTFDLLALTGSPVALYAPFGFFSFLVACLFYLPTLFHHDEDAGWRHEVTGPSRAALLLSDSLTGTLLAFIAGGVFMAATAPALVFGYGTLMVLMSAGARLLKRSDRMRSSLLPWILLCVAAVQLFM